MSEMVAQKLELGDHGGTYCGNPLGRAVAHAVIKYLIDHDVSGNVYRMGRLALSSMEQWKQTYHDTIVDVRGRGLLLLIEFKDEGTASRVNKGCLERGLFVNQIQGTGIRIFPALNIQQDELEKGLSIIKEAIEIAIKEGG